ncbi:MAG: branched-chain amino acid transport system II carrier protein [Candidatus Schmidhempelia sp.]|nr:branched-chain amino acid transport system II carrier protein [Candidatus Schmidhempelia sp.]
MAKQSYSSSQIVFIGITLFSLFFGAGNLIFPVMLGQLSGNHVWIAISGFIITGVLLPLLGVMALGYSGEKDFLKLCQRLGPIFGLIFATTLYLAIGPLFAMPRTGSVSFEMSVKPFISPQYESIYLAIFTLIYFGSSCLLSINPTKIVAIVGKFLTPIMLLFIAILIILSIVQPRGEMQQALTKEYIKQPFFSGFTEGYLTMDTLASLIFGIIIVDNINRIGITNRVQAVKTCLKASIIAGCLLAILYISLAYLGATSVQATGILKNGGEILVKAAIHYFGPLGTIILGVIVVLACITTTIGLTIACANYCHKLISTISYKWYVILFSTASMLFANVGLNQLIAISVPILYVIYPLTIVLIILLFTHTLFKGKKAVYVGAMYSTLFVSIFDGLNAANLSINTVNKLFEQYLPFYSASLGWIFMAIIGAIIGYLFDIIYNKK